MYECIFVQRKTKKHNNMKAYTSLTIGTKECQNYSALILAETEKAYKVDILTSHNSVAASRIEWFPKSQTKVTKINNDDFLTITPWIAFQKCLIAEM